MQNEYRDNILHSLQADERALIQALQRVRGDTDGGKTLRQLARELQTDESHLRHMLHKLRELSLVESAPEGALSDGGRHYRLTGQGKGMR